MAGAATNKKTPSVTAVSPVENLAEHYEITRLKQSCEKRLKTLSPIVLALIPKHRTQAAFPAVRNSKAGEYVVTKVSQDRRAPDSEKLMALLNEKGLVKEGTSPVPDHAKIKALVETGRITQAELGECLSGPKYSYPLVTFKEATAKDDD